MSAIFRLCCAFLLLCLTTTARAEHVTIPTEGFRLAAEYMPPLKNQGPVVLLLHGCGGLYAQKGEVSTRILRTANWFQELGIGVLMLDSFSARGIKSTCSVRNSRQLDEVTRADDAESALAWLKKRPEVDKGRLGVMGWSHGADAALELAHRDAPAIRGAVLFYPACRKFLNLSRFRIAAPTLVLIGESDEWTTASDCKALSQKSGQDLFHIVTYPEAYHDFDAPSQTQYMRNDVPNTVPLTREGDGVMSGPNPEAALDAYLRTFKWFSRWLDPARMLHGVPPVNMRSAGEPLLISSPRPRATNTATERPAPSSGSAPAASRARALSSAYLASEKVAPAASEPAPARH